MNRERVKQYSYTENNESMTVYSSVVDGVVVWETVLHSEDGKTRPSLYTEKRKAIFERCKTLGVEKERITKDLGINNRAYWKKHLDNNSFTVCQVFYLMKKNIV